MSSWAAESPATPPPKTITCSCILRSPFCCLCPGSPVPDRPGARSPPSLKPARRRAQRARPQKTHRPRQESGAPEVLGRRIELAVSLQVGPQPGFGAPGGRLVIPNEDLPEQRRERSPDVVLPQRNSPVHFDQGSAAPRSDV